MNTIINITGNMTAAPATTPNLYLDALQTSAALLTLVLFGFFWRAVSVFSPRPESLSKYLFYVAIPCLVFKGLSSKRFATIDFSYVLVFLCLRVALAVLFAIVYTMYYYCYKREPFDYGQFVMGYMNSTWMNTIIFGLPIVQALYGGPAGIYPILAAISSFFFQLPLHIVCFEISAVKRAEFRGGGGGGGGEDDVVLPIDDQFKMSSLKMSRSCNCACRWTRLGRKILFAVLINPIMVAIICGIVWSFLEWEFPLYLTLVTDLAGNTVTPIAAFAVGVAMYRKLDTRVWKHVLVFLLVKFFLMPLLCIPFLRAFKFRGEAAEIGVLISTMPLAVSCFVFSSKYGVGKEESSAAITLSTVLMLPIVLLWIAIVKEMHL